ncbi:LacI family DNA-binding transcriptional regulator [Anianabacter salinae]|uniref:LacI family DNA-binding transcriptional regulator n=1 Tax=Anianabacter salinae TaxID=2851023 RepID=UPI00225E2F43|nr:LacI family DNA-binding transcriptional regulator [Anianabacter salinae]MBV0912293.1 LacI family DNA-binding transcriptional regulator [Anianabacter salinae]
MARRPTVQDVAREAGVSVTTVDRALNGRSRVREETMRKIAQAAHKVGYHARGLIERNLDVAVPEMTFGFLLIKKSQEFYQNFAREIELAVASRGDIRGKAIIRFAFSQSPDDFAAGLRGLSGCDAIAATAVNHQRLTQVVSELKGQGVPVFSLLNDFAQGVRRNYLGMNNMKIGRTAAWIITRTVPQPGKLAIFVGGNRWHGHDLREVGFRSYVRENAPGFTVLDSLVNLETRQLTYEATLDLVGRHHDLKGIYVAGGGMEGAIAALREIHATPRVALVVNEATKDSRAALSDGYATMVISTPLAALCADLVDLMVHSVREGDDGISGQHFLDPHIVLPEML